MTWKISVRLLSRVIFIVSLLCMIQLASATTVATLSWSKSLGYRVNSVDTNEAGILVYAGISNGTAVCYDSGGTLQWADALNTSNSITKVRVSPDGSTLVAMDSGGWIYGIDSASGAILLTRRDAPTIMDVEVSRNGYFAALYTDRFYIYNSSGSIIGSNFTYGISSLLRPGENYLNFTYDPVYGEYMVTSTVANASIRKWILTPYEPFKGWQNLTYNTPTDRERLLNSYLWNRTIAQTNTFPESSRISIRVWDNQTGYDAATGGGNTTSNIFMQYRDVPITAPRDLELTYPNKTSVDANYTYYGAGANTSVVRLNTSSSMADDSISLTYALGKFWGVGGWMYPYNSQSWSSPDGRVWTLRNSSIFRHGVTKTNIGWSNIDNKFHVVGGYDYDMPGYIEESWNSSDGVTWTLSNRTAIPGGDYMGHFIGNFNGKMYVLGGSAARVWRSSDGITWTIVNGATPFAIGSSVWTINNTIFAGLAIAGTVYKSEDGGVTWLTVNGSSVAPGFLAGAYDFPVEVYGNYVYATGISGAVFRTDEIGRVWTRQSEASSWGFGMLPGDALSSTGNYPNTTTNLSANKMIIWDMPLATQSGILTLGPEDYVDITWRVDPNNSNYVLYYGNRSKTTTISNASITPQRTFEGTISSENANTSLIYPRYNISINGTGDVNAMDSPELGSWIVWSAGGINPRIYHQQMSSAGFGSQYTGSANTGNALDIAAGDAAAFTTEARGLYADIYQLDATRKGTYTTGGNVRSVDIAVKNSLWTIAGGDDGKFYVFSKDATSSWYVYYQGDSESPIYSTAISWRGEYAAVGRADGTLEYYNLQSGTTGSTYLIDVYVSKGASLYTNQTIEVYSSVTTPYSWVLSYSGLTDGYGKYSFSAVDSYYYKVVINSGEAETIYQATTNTKIITISIPAPLITSPYIYDAVYDTGASNVTFTYQDVSPAQYVNLTFVDIKNGIVVRTDSYTTVSALTVYYHDAAGSGEYKVIIDITRFNGANYKDTKFAVTPNRFILSFGGTSEGMQAWKFGLYTLFLTIFAMGIGAVSIKYGAPVLVGLTILGIFLGFLPATLFTLSVVGTATFIAFLAVARRE